MSEYPEGLDVECQSLYDALNRLSGITTTESCCGHGNTPFQVWFTVDCTDPELYLGLGILSRCLCVKYHADPVARFTCELYHDDTYDVSFLLEGPSGGYTIADELAATIHTYMDADSLSVVNFIADLKVRKHYPEVVEGI